MSGPEKVRFEVQKLKLTEIISHSDEVPKSELHALNNSKYAQRLNSFNHDLISLKLIERARGDAPILSFLEMGRLS